MFWTKSDRKFIDKMIQNSISRKTKKFRRNFHINHIQTDVEVIKVKDKFLESFGGYNDLPDKTVYQIYNKKKFNTVFFRTNVDILVTSQKGKIIEFHRNVVPNKKFVFPKEINFIWVMKPDLINYLKLNVETDTIGTI